MITKPEELLNNNGIDCNDLTIELLEELYSEMKEYIANNLLQVLQFIADSESNLNRSISEIKIFQPEYSEGMAKDITLQGDYGTLTICAACHDVDEFELTFKYTTSLPLFKNSSFRTDITENIGAFDLREYLGYTEEEISEILAAVNAINKHLDFSAFSEEMLEDDD